MGDAADDALAYGEARREDRINERDQRRYEASQALGVLDLVLSVGRALGFGPAEPGPSCRCEPGAAHPQCDAHFPDQPEPRDPWLTHYDPFVHGRL